jgi:hypothetical protein
MVMVAIISVMAGVIGIASYYYLGPNNPVEEVAEEVIKDETGIDVNLSPEAKAANPAPTAPESTPSTQAPTPPTVASA